MKKTNDSRVDNRLTAPQEGITRCWCGSKYWDGETCHSCGEKWQAATKTGGK